MSLLLVLHVCERDEALALRALRASEVLDGRIKTRLILAFPTSFNSTEVWEKAKLASTEVGFISYAPWTGDTEWPRRANYAWQSVARQIDAHDWQNDPYTGWLWWEADATPIRPGWYDTLNKAHSARPRTLFAGSRQLAIDGTSYMNGVGIWPMNLIEPLANCPALYTQKVPFDMAAARPAMASFKSLNHLMVHERKRQGGGPGRSFDSTRFRDLLATHKQAVFYHGCTDGSLHALVAGEEPPVNTERPEADPRLAVKLGILPTLDLLPNKSGRSTFYHSGDLGDVIYSLPTVRERGGGDLALGPDNRTNMATRERMTPERAALLQPLLEAQPYLHSVTYSATLPKTTSCDLNQMRQLLRSHRLDMQPNLNLARCYLQAFGLALDNDSTPWLTVPSPVAKAPVVIARSPRYHDATFRWDRILTTYRGQCLFLGTPEEHASFERAWGPIPYHPTPTLLDLAQVIAGCHLFIGNQSLPYAVAEGLKKPAILEACPSGSNTLFARKDVTVGVTEDTLLPDVVKGRVRRRPVKGKLTIAGPVDWFTGLGRVTCQLIEHLYTTITKIEAHGVNRRIPLPPKVEAHLQLTNGRAGNTRLLISPLLNVPTRIKPGDTVLTMWESTRLPAAGVEALNKYASQVVVPSSWCATTFSGCGVNAPIVVVPLGVDTQVYKPMRTSLGERPHVITFGAAGRLAHGGKRKGIEDVITAFQLAFPDEESVNLTLKLFDDCYIPPFSDHRIQAITSTLTDGAMAEWYNNLDCFISLARGEGWGLHAAEALACGVPVIAPAYSGLADIVPASPLPFTIVEATEGYLGHWCQPSIEQAAEAMKLLMQGTPLPVAGRVHTVEMFANGVLEVLQ